MGRAVRRRRGRGIRGVVGGVEEGAGLEGLWLLVVDEILDF